MIRALCVLLLVAFGMPLSACADETNALTTILLTARADLPDPHFKDSIVLVMNHLGPAPTGVIINRPTRIPVAQLFPDLEPLAKLEDKIYFGGPVGIESVSFLVRAEKAPEHATQVLDGVYVSTDRDLLRDLLSRENPMEGLRIFIGFSGWAPGQLENEISRGDWKLGPANATTVFGHKSEHVWPERQQAPGGGNRASGSITMRHA